MCMVYACAANTRVVTVVALIMYTCLILLGLVNGGGVLALKVWQPTTDIGEPSNWPPKGTPQRCDIMDLSRANALHIRLSGVGDVGVSQVVMPRDGDLSIPDSMSFSLASATQCLHSVHKVVKLKRSDIKAWLDPASWNYTLPPGRWLPHSWRVPCAGETVVFPPERGFTIVLPNILRNSGDIIFGNKKYNSEEWMDFLRSPEGYENFDSTGDERIMPWRRSSGHNWYCGMAPYNIVDWSYKNATSGDFDEAVCQFERPRCQPTERLPCLEPLQPEAHCCPICGAVLEVRGSSWEASEIKEVESILDSMIAESDTELLLNVGRMSDDRIQIVLVARNGDSSAAGDVARRAVAAISERYLLKGGKLTMRHSGRKADRNPFKEVSATVWGSFFFVLGIFASVYYFNVIFPTHKWIAGRRSYMFARFQNTAEEDAVSLNPATQHQDSFNNPLYRPGELQEEPEQDSESVEAEPQAETSTAQSNQHTDTSNSAAEHTSLEQLTLISPFEAFQNVPALSDNAILVETDECQR